VTGPVLVVENLSLQLGDFALGHLDLRVEEGEILVLLGPNGAGKSVTLETIAGFHRPATGRIAIGGREVTLLPPEKRNIGLLFQDFGLFPHLSVAENVAVGLCRKRRSTGARQAVAELLSRFGIAGLAGRDPRSLSAGERQRVALARAFAAAPRLFLFDEPFSSLDGQTRSRLRGEIREFLRGCRVPAIFVTHDLADVPGFADRIAVMRAGAVIQSGDAAGVLRRPANRFVAELLGFDNIIPGQVLGRSCQTITVAVADQRLELPAPPFGDSKEEVWLCLRAEDVEFDPQGSGLGGRPGQHWRLAARVRAIEDQGAVTKVTLDCGFPLHALAMSRRVRELGLAAGTEVEAVVLPDALHLIPAV
jgi:ABC-type Fe3+/spermidine/putrescine transport system ATPase subunit